MTVAEAIEILKTKDPNAVICEWIATDPDNVFYSEWSGIMDVEIKYIAQNGDDKEGKVVYFWD